MHKRISIVKRGESIIGLTIDRLTVGPVVPCPDGYKPNGAWHICDCICGTQVTVRRNDLIYRGTRSCGCLNRENAIRVGKGKRTHGESPWYKHHPASKEYRAWRHMISRCSNPRVKNFHRYGGRGIIICSQWRESFDQFLSDVGRAPTAKHSLGRIKNDLGYVPGNVEWQTTYQQVRNTSLNRFLELNGVRLTIGDWEKKTGIKRRTIQMRIDVYGYTEEEALTTPVQHRH